MMFFATCSVALHCLLMPDSGGGLQELTGESRERRGRLVEGVKEKERERENKMAKAGF